MVCVCMGGGGRRREERVKTTIVQRLSQNLGYIYVPWNLEIAQVYCAILRSCNYSAQSRDSENAQWNLEIA